MANTQLCELRQQVGTLKSYEFLHSERLASWRRSGITKEPGHGSCASPATSVVRAWPCRPARGPRRGGRAPCRCLTRAPPAGRRRQARTLADDPQDLVPPLHTGPVPATTTTRRMADSTVEHLTAARRTRHASSRLTLRLQAPIPRRLNPDTSGIRRRSRYRGSRQEARRPDDERAVQASKLSSLWTRDAPNLTVDMRVVGGADRGWHGVTIFKSAGQGKIMG